MGLEAGNPVVGGTVLRRAAIQSPNFVHNALGWNIAQDGSAEFNNLVSRGSVSSEGTLGTVFAQVVILDGQILFQQSSFSTGPWFTVGQIGIAHFTSGPTASSITQVSGGFVIDNGASGGILIYPPSGDVTGNADSAIIQEFLTLGYSVMLTPGQFYWLANQISVTQSSLYIRGAGIGKTLIQGVGTGIVFSCHNSSTEAGGGGFTGFTMDLTGMGAGSIGVDLGDVIYYEVDGVVANSPAQGWRVRNVTGQTERLHGNMYARHNVQGIVYDRTGGSNSMARTEVTHWITTGDPMFDGVVVNNVTLYDGRVDIRGNMTGGATTNVNTISGTQAACLKLTGAGGKIINSQLDIGVECGPGANVPMSIFFSASANIIFQTAGVMNFGAAGNNFASSNWPGSGSFLGPVIGDPALADLVRLAQSVKFDSGLSTGHGNAAQALANNSIITTAGLTYAPCSLTAAVTGIILQAGTTDGQIMIVANEAGIASGFTITFAAAGSNVGDPAVVINSQTAAMFIWNIHTVHWLRTH